MAIQQSLIVMCVLWAVQDVAATSDTCTSSELNEICKYVHHVIYPFINDIIASYQAILGFGRFDSYIRIDAY